MGGASRFRARQRARAVKMEAMQAEQRNREAIQADRLRNMSLYICTFEDYSDWKNQKLRYRIQSIKLSDLLSFSSTPITVFSSKSNVSNSSSNLVREVDFVEGDLPLHMSFGVFGSRIVLAGGCKSDRGTTEIYVLETDPTVEPRPKFIEGPGEQQREAKPQYAIPKFNGGKSSPFMVEVKGKLYALTGSPFTCSEFPTFEVFDPENKVWTALPDPPLGNPVSMKDPGSFTHAVVGTKILVKSQRSPLLYFDLADPLKPWGVLTPHHHGLPPCLALVLDLEDDDDHKLLFTLEWNHILVDLMIVSTESEIYSIEPLAEINVPYGFQADSYSCADLGGGIICFVLMNLGEYVKMPVLFMTFQFSFSKSAASPHFSSSTGSPPSCSSSDSPHSGGNSGSDPDFLYRVLSDIRSFSVKSLGCRIFEYNWSEESSHPLYAELVACFVL
ncbi:hypothetical protein M0R45_018661 [Rubus argutus]|uniref:Uncharacterized protein n=1 Tax=Rubus argutus TaxID=59490 RepID=A0AAW1X6X2_RUBAR